MLLIPELGGQRQRQVVLCGSEATELVPGQSRLYRKILSKKTENKTCPPHPTNQ